MMKINWLGIITVFVIALPASASNHGKPTKTSFEAPVLIYYYNRNDKINMNITFRNQPEGSYNYIIQYKLSTKEVNEPGELNTKNQYISIKQHMVPVSVRISVILYNIYNESCSTKLIFDGKENQRIKNGQCFTSNACQVLVNFPVICTKGQLGFKINCTSSDGSYNCSSEKTSLITNSYLHWYQYYSDGTIIGNASLPNTTKSYFSFKLENFDYNSYINSTIKSGKTNNAQMLMKSNVHQIRFPKNETMLSKVVEKKYSESKLFVFSCAHYWGYNIIVQVAIIDTSTNTLKPFSLDAVNMTKPGTELDGQILCCLIYEVKNIDTVGYIERRVENKTLLVYEPRGKQLNQMELSRFYPILMTALIFLLLAVIVIIIFKKLRKKRESRRTVELDTYACPDRVVYAELNVNQDTRQPHNLDESPYAEIAGVLKAKQVQLFR